MARITSWRNGMKTDRSTYAENLHEAILGAEVSEFEGELVQTRIGIN